MKLRAPHSVMSCFITCLSVCAMLNVLTTGPARAQGVRGRSSAAKSAAPKEAAQGQPGAGSVLPQADGANNSNCLFVNANLDGDNAVEAFAAHKKRGTLTPVGRFETGGLGDPFVGGFQQHSIITAGRYLYAVNPGDNTVSAFEIGGDCSLELIDTESSGGVRPVSLAAGGNLLYVANGGHSPIQAAQPASLAGFRIENDGTLSPLACPVVPTQAGGFGNTIADVVFNKAGDVLVATLLLPNEVNSYRVGRNGCLSAPSIRPGGGGPFGALFSPARAQQLFVTTAVPELFSGPTDRAPGVDSYLVDRSGRLHLVDFFQDFFDPGDEEKSNEALRDPCWLAMTKNGRYLWVSSFIPSELTLFRVNAQGNIGRVLDRNGRPSVWDPEDIIDNPDQTDPLGAFFLGSTDIALDHGGDFLYQLRVFDVASEGARPLTPQIHVLRVTGDWDVNGGLALVQKVTLEEDLSLAGTMGIALSGPGNGK